MGDTKSGSPAKRGDVLGKEGRDEGSSLKKRSEEKGSFLIRLEEIESTYVDKIHSLETEAAAQSAEIRRLRDSSTALQLEVSAAHGRLEQQERDHRIEMPHLKEQITTLEEAVGLASREGARERDALLKAQHRCTDLELQNAILRTTLGSAETAAAAASDEAQRSAQAIDELQAHETTVRQAFCHVDDLSEGLRSRIESMCQQGGLVLQNQVLLSAVLGDKGASSFRSTVHAIQRQLEAQKAAHATMRQLCGIAHASALLLPVPVASIQVAPSPEREREDAVRQCAVTAIAAAAAPGFLSPRRVDDRVVLLLKLLEDGEKLSHESREELRSTLHCDIAEAIAVDASQLQFDFGATVAGVVQLSISPSASAAGCLHRTPAALATLLVAQCRMEGSRLRQGTASRTIVGVSLLSDFTELIRSLSRTIRHNSYGWADGNEQGDGRCSLKEIFCDVGSGEDTRGSDQDKACQNDLLLAGQGSERAEFSVQMSKLLDTAQVLLGRLSLIQGLPRIGRVVYSVRTNIQGTDSPADMSTLSRSSSSKVTPGLGASMQSLSSSAFTSSVLQAGSSPSIKTSLNKRTVLARISPHLKTPPACQGVSARAHAASFSSSPLVKSSLARGFSPRNQLLNRLREDLSALRVRCNMVRAEQAAQQRRVEELQRITSSRATKLMLLNAQITKISRQKMEHAQQLEVARLGDQKQEEEARQAGDLEVLSDRRKSLEGLRQEFAQLEAAIAHVTQQFRDSSNLNQLNLNQLSVAQDRLIELPMCASTESQSAGAREELFETGTGRPEAACGEEEGRTGSFGGDRAACDADMAEHHLLERCADSPSPEVVIGVKVPV